MQKNFNAKNDVANNKSTKIYVDLFLQQQFLCNSFCLFIFAMVYSAAYIFVYLIKITI